MRRPNDKDKMYWYGTGRNRRFDMWTYQRDMDEWRAQEKAKSDRERQRAEANVARQAKVAERAKFEADKAAAIAAQRAKDQAKATERAEWQRQRDEAIARDRERAAQKRADKHKGGDTKAVARADGSTGNFYAGSKRADGPYHGHIETDASGNTSVVREGGERY